MRRVFRLGFGHHTGQSNSHAGGSVSIGSSAMKLNGLESSIALTFGGVPTSAVPERYFKSAAASASLRSSGHPSCRRSFAASTALLSANADVPRWLRGQYPEKYFADIMLYLLSPRLGDRRCQRLSCDRVSVCHSWEKATAALLGGQLGLGAGSVPMFSSRSEPGNLSSAVPIFLLCWAPMRTRLSCGFRNCCRIDTCLDDSSVLELDVANRQHN